MPLCRAALVMTLALSPAGAETPNLMTDATGHPGPAARLILASRTQAEALRQNDIIALIVAIRLARGLTLRPPTAWEKTTTGDLPADQSAGGPAAPDPGGPDAIAIAQGFAGDDPDLQDLVFDLDAQLPHSRAAAVISATSDLGSGQIDSWTLPLSGAVPAEIGLIGDGDTPLLLTVTDETGATLCARPASADPQLCRFTPVRNGFFTVTVQNPGPLLNSYRLLGN